MHEIGHALDAQRLGHKNFKKKYEKLKRKHIQILNFYDFEYELEELSNEDECRLFKLTDCENGLRCTTGCTGTLVELELINEDGHTWVNNWCLHTIDFERYLSLC